jgi:hypothetical protein
LLGFEPLLVGSILHLKERFLIVCPIQLRALFSDGLKILEDKFVTIEVRDVLHAGKDSIWQ